MRKEDLHLCVGRRLGEDIPSEIMQKIHGQRYQTVLVFPRLKTDDDDEGTHKNHADGRKILSLNDLIEKMNSEHQFKWDDSQKDNPQEEVMRAGEATRFKDTKRKVLLLVLDATWKYAREMHIANKKYRQYPPNMLQVALEKEDLEMDGDNNIFRPRRFEIRAKVSATGGKRAANEEDTKTTWISTAECIAWIVSRLEEELFCDEKEDSITGAAIVRPNEESFAKCRHHIYKTLMKPLDVMVAKWRAFLDAPKIRKHDLERGCSKRNKKKAMVQDSG
jgi:hypothetical protein